MECFSHLLIALRCRAFKERASQLLGQCRSFTFGYLSFVFEIRFVSDDGDHGFLLKWVDKVHQALHVLEAFPISYRVDEHQSVGPERPTSDTLFTNRLGQKEEVQVNIKFKAIKTRISVSLELTFTRFVNFFFSNIFEKVSAVKW